MGLPAQVKPENTASAKEAPARCIASCTLMVRSQYSTQNYGCPPFPHPAGFKNFTSLRDRCREHTTALRLGRWLVSAGPVGLLPARVSGALNLIPPASLTQPSANGRPLFYGQQSAIDRLLPAACYSGRLKPRLVSGVFPPAEVLFLQSIQKAQPLSGCTFAAFWLFCTDPGEQSDGMVSPGCSRNRGCRPVSQKERQHPALPVPQSPESAERLAGRQKPPPRARTGGQRLRCPLARHPEISV